MTERDPAAPPTGRRAGQVLSTATLAVLFASSWTSCVSPDVKEAYDIVTQDGVHPTRLLVEVGQGLVDPLAYFDGKGYAFVRDYGTLLPDTYLIDAGSDPVAKLEDLMDDLGRGALVRIEPDPVLSGHAFQDDPLLDGQWNLRNEPARAEGINLPSTGPPSAGGIQIGVIDSGVFGRHPDLDGLVDEGLDLISERGGTYDPWGHGTRIAGIMGARAGDAVGMSGVAADLQILPIRVMHDGQGFLGEALAALERFLSTDARVITLCWSTEFDSSFLHDALANASATGRILVAPAGNHGGDLAVDPVYPAAYDDVPNLVVVAASKPDGSLADFSGYGYDHVTIAAPGVDILTTLPTESWSRASGTSFAVPHVAAAIAVWLSRLSTPPDPGVVVTRLKDRARKLPSLTGKVGAEGVLDIQLLLAP